MKKRSRHLKTTEKILMMFIIYMVRYREGVIMKVDARGRRTSVSKMAGKMRGRGRADRKSSRGYLE
jgi:hypothetical protein